MASKRRLRRKECTGKTRYADQAAAVRVMIRAKERGEKNLNTYRCARCSGWHIGHKPRWFRKIVGGE